MKKLVMIRHGESEWNKQNLFTGWSDVDLSETGRKEAREAGRLLSKEGLLTLRENVTYCEKVNKQ